MTITKEKLLFLDSFVFLSVTSQDLRSLTLKNCHWVTVDSITALTFHQNNLEEVDLTSCWDLGDESLITFLQTFRRQ